MSFRVHKVDENANMHFTWLVVLTEMEANQTRKILAVVAITIFALSITTLASPVRADPSGSDWTLTVLSPTAHQVITTPTLSLHVIAHGYRLDARYAGTPNLPRIGHYHEILDGNLIDMTPAINPTHDTISMVGVKPGTHVLTIVPARNDHSMIMQNAVNIPFTYAGTYLPAPGPFAFNGPASVGITSVVPTPGQTDERGESQTDDVNSFIMTVNVQNFVLSGESFGKDLQNGVGHWHIFAETPDIAVMGPEMANMLTMASDSSQEFYVVGLSPGIYTFFAVLVDNHHMPFVIMNPDGTMSLAPGTFDSVTLNINPID